MDSEDFKNVFMAVLTERIVWKQTRTLLLAQRWAEQRRLLIGVLKVNLSRLTKQTVDIEHTSLIVLDFITCLDYVGLQSSHTLRLFQ